MNDLITLTAREKQIAECLLYGLTNREIGRRLGIKARTVKARLYEIGRTLKMSEGDRVPLAIWLHEHRQELQICCPCDLGIAA